MAPCPCFPFSSVKQKALLLDLSQLLLRIDVWNLSCLSCLAWECVISHIWGTDLQTKICWFFQEQNFCKWLETKKLSNVQLHILHKWFLHRVPHSKSWLLVQVQGAGYISSFFIWCHWPCCEIPWATLLFFPHKLFGIMLLTLEHNIHVQCSYQELKMRCHLQNPCYLLKKISSLEVYVSFMIPVMCMCTSLQNIL